MPTYEYRCRKCGEFEVTQRITDTALTRCPTCRGKVAKLISNTSFQLKGSGWYVTDYARKDSSKGKETSTDLKSAESKSTESKPESKSDTTTKSETKSDSSTNKTKEVAAA